MSYVIISYLVEYDIIFIARIIIYMYYQKLIPVIMLSYFEQVFYEIISCV